MRIERPPRTYDGRTSTGEPMRAAASTAASASSAMAQSGGSRPAPGRPRPPRPLDGVGAVVGDGPVGRAQAEACEELGEARAVLGEVDRRGARAEHGDGRVAEAAGELERFLAAELDDDADVLLALDDRDHVLRVERLEVEPVG